MRLPINTIIFVFFLLGIIALQVFLSKRENKWLGLMIPSLSVASSLLVAIGRAMYDNNNLAQILIFLVYNIPTMILLVIYFACRENLKKNKEIDKMNIQDLN